MITDRMRSERPVIEALAARTLPAPGVRGRSTSTLVRRASTVARCAQGDEY